MEGIASGSTVVGSGKSLRVNVGEGLIGRVVDGLGNPIDGLGPIKSDKYYPVQNSPPSPLERKVIREPLSVGVKGYRWLINLWKRTKSWYFCRLWSRKSTLMGYDFKKQYCRC